MSGSDSSGIDSRFWQTGQLEGYFNISYNFYSVPDSMVIGFGGQTIFSTGGYVSGSQTVSLYFGPANPGASTLLNVLMNPQGPRPGTAWDYVLTPTGKPVLQSLRVAGRTALDENTAGTYYAEATYSTGSTRIVVARWSTNSPALTLGPAGMDVRVTANGVTSTTSATLTASYTEDGVTMSRSVNVAIADQPITANPNALERVDAGKRGDSSVGGPVDTATGAENFSRSLIALSGARELEFAIAYNSLQVAAAGDLGYGWSHPFLATIAEATSGSDATVTVRWSQNRIHRYTLVRSTFGAYFRCADDAAQYDTLAKTADNGFILTKPDQTVYSFNSSGVLTEIANGHGQRLVVTRSSSALASISDPISGARLTFTYATGRISRIADSAGRSTSLTYNQDGLLAEIVDVGGRKTSYAYDSARRLASVTAPDGAVIYRNTYDARGRVATQDDGVEGNQLTRFAYDEESQPGRIVTTVTNRVGAATVYTHDGLYRLISVRDPLGRVTELTYDASGNRIAAKDPAGRSTRWTYDSAGNVLTTTSADGKQTTFVYDAKNQVTSATDADGKTATYRYDARNNPIEAIDAAGAKVVRTYDANSLLTREVSGRGNATTFTHQNGRVATRTDPLGNRTSFAYDAAGRVVSVTDSAGGARRFSYSATGKLLEQLEPLDQKTTYAYDVRDRLATMTDALGGTTRMSYDANSNLLTRIDAAGGVTKFEYDGEDRPTRTIDSRGNATSLVYDAAGQLTTRSDALGNSTKFAYDTAGNLTSITDALGNVIRDVTYDQRNLPTIVRDGLNRSRTSTFDALRRPSRRTDALGQVTNFSYDALGRLTQATDALGAASRQSYDADGNRLSLVNAADATTTFAYDAAGRITTLTTPSGRRTSYTYDSRGLLTGTTKPSGQAATRSYDRAGRLTRVADPAGTIDFTYDAKNRLLTTTEGGRTITRTYDVLDRVTSFTDRDGNRLTYEYDANGNPTALGYPDGKKVAYAYDAANRLTTVTDWAGRVTAYSYDANGRLLRTIRPNGTIEQRSYDRAGQLVQVVDRAKDGTMIVQHDYDYDASGRLSSELRTPSAPAYLPEPMTMVYDGDNRMTTFGGQALTYDADGNMTRGPVGGSLATLAYDARNRLTSAAGLTYTYDAENRRIQVTGASGATRYVINPNSALSQVLTTTSPTGVTTRYVYGLGLLYQETGTALSQLHYDFRGSTIALTGNDGAVIGRIGYAPFGEIISRTGDTATPFLFVGNSGVETDANGLVYMRARHYQPQLGRFLQLDPLLGTPDPSARLNRYAYGNCDPVGAMDPLGLDAITSVWGGGRILGGVFEAASGIGLAAVTGWTGVGAIAGGAVALHGIDQVQAGMRQMWSGEAVDSLTAEGLQSLGVSQRSANIADAGLSVIGSLGAGGATSMIRIGQTSVSTAAADANLAQRLIYYEIGQKTMTNANYANYSGITDPVLRGMKIVADQGWLRALLPEGGGWMAGLGTTLGTGPTPLGWLGVGAVGAGLGAARVQSPGGK